MKNVFAHINVGKIQFERIIFNTCSRKEVNTLLKAHMIINWYPHTLLRGILHTQMHSSLTGLFLRPLKNTSDEYLQL